MRLLAKVLTILSMFLILGPILSSLVAVGLGKCYGIKISEAGCDCLVFLGSELKEILYFLYTAPMLLIITLVPAFILAYFGLFVSIGSKAVYTGLIAFSWCSLLAILVVHFVLGG